MTDYFALLDEPRRPWVDAEQLKQRFLSLSAGVHPDRVHALGEAERAAAQDRYTALNAAYQCLREPRERLRHLLELERGAVARDVQNAPSDLMDLSMQIGQACRQADALLNERAHATSRLLQVQFFERTQEQTEKLQSLQQQMTARQDKLLAALRTLDAEWSAESLNNPVDRANLLQRIEELYRLFGYFARWSEQLRERMVRLSF